MSRLKIVQILWKIAKVLNEFWPEASEWTDEKDLLIEVALLLLEKAGVVVDFPAEDDPVHTMRDEKEDGPEWEVGYGKETIK